MGSKTLQRPARLPAPEVRTAPRPVPGPPQLQPPPGGAAAWLPYLLPMLGSAGALLFVLSNPTPLYIAAACLFAAGSLGVGVAMGYVQRSSARARTVENRSRYLEHLRQVRHDCRDTAARQRAAGHWRHPEPAQLWGIAGSRLRLWERRRGDSDLLHVRVGVGRAPLAAPLEPAEPDPLARLDGVAVAELRRLVADYTTTDGVPLVVPLAETGVLSIVGPPETARGLLRALVAEAVTLHPPEDLRLVCCVEPAAVASWEWTKWLPHAGLPAGDVADNSVAALCTPADLPDLLAPEVARRRGNRRNPEAQLPQLLIVLDTGGTPVERHLGGDAALPGLAGLGITLIRPSATRTEEPSHVDVRLTVADGAAGPSVELTDAAGTSQTGFADQLGQAAAEAVARKLASWRLGLDDGDRALTGTVGISELLNLGDVAVLDPGQRWTGIPVAQRLRVPLGISSDGVPLELDLKESARGGMGPHGLVVGATGSGKSELLRTLVLALASRHQPEELALVLVDFKGGAAFAGLQPLPHVAGMITNLADDLALVDRMREALFGELRRRQELLRRAGDLDDIWSYQTARLRQPQLEPMPSLLVVVDEFGELLAGRPDFAELFVAIGRLGRSLGVHLLLASQRLEEGRLRGLDSHLSYRIGLRTFSVEDSRAVLGVPDAYQLPPLPGSAYLKVDTSVFTRFKVALSSATYAPPAEADSQLDRPELFDVRLPLPVQREGGSPGSNDSELALPENAPTVLDVAVGRLARGAPPVHQVWLPPLPPALALDDLLAGHDTSAVAAQPADPLAIPIGLVDKPAEQSRETLQVDLAGAHLLVVGGPQSGKSTLLRTLLLSAAMQLSPADLHLFAVDAGGGNLASLAELPHVAGVAARLDRERVRRILATVTGLLERRERIFRELQLDGAAAMRRARQAAGSPASGPAADDLADVLIVVDGWSAFRTDYEDLEPAVIDIATRGLGYGVHLVVTAGRWGDVRAPLRDAIAGRLELRLADPLDSDIDRKAAAALPERVPGRGLSRDRLTFQAALPRLDGAAAVSDLRTATDSAVARVASRTSGPAAPAVRLLPASLELAELPPPAADATGIPVGIGETDLAPVLLDLQGGDPHLLVLGDSEAGKTTLLRTYLHGLQLRHSPREAVAVVVDYRRTLLDVVDDEHLLAYAGAAPAAAETLAELATLLSARLPPSDVSREALRTRSWWSGPDVYLVVDDYDLVAAPSGNPLAPLAELLPQARDIGLHVLLARRVSGISRSMFDTFFGRLRELGTAAVLMSGDPAEGPLVGTHRAAELPPGRGLLVRRRQQSLLIQVAQTPEEPTPEEPTREDSAP